MSAVSKPIGLTRHTADLILLYLTIIGRPARASEVRQAVVKICPESASPIYGCLGDLLLSRTGTSQIRLTPADFFA